MAYHRVKYQIVNSALWGGWVVILLGHRGDEMIHTQEYGYIYRPPEAGPFASRLEAQRWAQDN